MAEGLMVRPVWNQTDKKAAGGFHIFENFS